MSVSGKAALVPWEGQNLRSRIRLKALALRLNKSLNFSRPQQNGDGEAVSQGCCEG